MRIVGNSLMVVGAAAMMVATAGLFGMNVRVDGSDMFPGAMAAPAVFVAGALLIAGGAWIRRRAKRRAATEGAVQRAL